MQLKRYNQSGDTIIEVILAIAVFSLVAIAGLSVMNKGNASAQRSLEITLVRNQINAQAEILRFWNAAYIAAYVQGASIDSYGPEQPAAPPDPAIPAKPAWNWADLSNRARLGGDLNTTAAGFATVAGAAACPDPTSGGKNVFVIDTKGIKVDRLISTGLNKNFFQAETYSKIKLVSNTYSGTDGLWIEAVRSTDGSESQFGIGYIDFHISACWSSVGQVVPMTLGTVVRLYEPR